MTYRDSGDLRSTAVTPAFFEMVMEYSQRVPSTFACSRQVRAPSGPDFPWIGVSYESIQLPEQGWKLHLAASPATAEQLLHCVLPLLLSEGVSFKVLSSLQDLEQLNNGSAGLSQIGKFLTIYPRHDEEAPRLASLLDAATEGIGGAPAIPSDRPLRPGSLVHYRYGSFHFQVIQTAWGEFQTVIQAPGQELIPDPRLSHYAPPSWAVDPFIAAGVAETLPDPHRFIAHRYVLLAPMYRSAQSHLYLATDLLTPRVCIIKSPGFSFAQGDGAKASEPSINRRLRTEAQVLAALAPHPAFPACYDLLEDQGKVWLVLEDIEGETLAQHLSEHYTILGRKLPYKHVLDWGQELATMLHELHTRGWIYRDLKASNLIVGQDGHLRLIDFGLAQPRHEETCDYGMGTFGYMSPQQQAGESARVSDDIYSLGAMLYLLATGAEPSYAPRDRPLTVRPLRVLHPTLDPDLCALIECCLHPDPQERFSSAIEVERALASLLAKGADIDLPKDQREAQPLSIDYTAEAEKYRDLASRLAATLAQAAVPDPQGNGVYWVSTHHVGKGRVSRDLNTGTSGSLLALAEAVAEFNDANQHHVLVQGAGWLHTSRQSYGTLLPGLYVGEAGVGTALLRAGQVLNNATLLDQALQQGRLVASLPFASPDLFNGTAGRLRFHLWLWKALADPEQLQAAYEAGEELLSSATESSPTEICWRIPEGYSTMSGDAFLGYAHGAAGIADVLLDLYEETQQERFLSAALSAARWLRRQTLPMLDDGSGLGWSEKEGGQVRGAYWCHGSAGVGRFFLHAAQLNVFAGATDLAERAARAVAGGNRACNPVQCHGLSGNIEFLLDMAQVTGKQMYRAVAFELAELLCAFAVEQPGKLLWPSESPTIFTPDYQVGYAGILLALLRLSDENRPHQLSLKGLGYKTSQRPYC